MSNLTNKLYQSRRVILDMVASRDFNINSYNNFTRNEIAVMSENMPAKSSSEDSPLDITINNSKSNKLLVKYVINSKLRQSVILSLIDDILTTLNEGDTLILIVKDKINNIDTLETYLDSYYDKDKIFVQIFWIDRLQVNIMEHVMVPEHTIINETEKQNLLKEWSVSSLNQLPLILSKDPVAKYLGMKKGDVCKIKRPSETSGIYMSYRYCQ
jgi:DNA-directed RNA polymerase subunit H (RpoH/RPB5)